MPAIESSQASAALETAISVSPATMAVRRPIRSTTSPITSTSPYMPRMWRLMIVKIEPCAWWCPTAT